MAPAQQQQDPDRLPAGALPTQALILGDPNQDGFSINIEFVEVDIRDVVLFFGQLTGINMVLDPGVSGPVTTQLFDVPWDTALLTILDSHDLGWQVQRNILRITTVQKLADAAEAQVRLMDQERLAQPLETEQLEFSNGDPIANLTTVAFFASLGGFDLGDPTAPTVRSATATTFNGIAQVLYRSASSGNATITAAVGTVSSSAAVTVEPDPEQGAIQLFFLVDGQQLTTTSGAASVASPFVRELTAILTDPETGTFRQGAQVRFRIIRDSTLGSGVGAAKFVGSPTSFTDQFGKAVAKLSVTEAWVTSR